MCIEAEILLDSVAAYLLFYIVIRPHFHLEPTVLLLKAQLSMRKLLLRVKETMTTIKSIKGGLHCLLSSRNHHCYHHTTHAPVCRLLSK